MKKNPKAEDETPPLPSESKILKDMERRKDIIKFDLTDKKWLDNPEAFWEEFEHTKQILIPHKFEDWLVGQDRIREEARLSLLEWVRKLKDISKLRKEGVELSDILRERPGPYLLLIGEPGCLVGDTRVALEDGRFARLEDLGERHLQHIDVGLQTNTGMDRAKVFHIYRNQHVLRVRTASGRVIIGTPNHPLQTEDGWKRIDELKPGDRLRVREKTDCTIEEDPEFEWNLWSWVNHTGTSWYETYQIPERYNPDLGYLFGYALGDGSVGKHRLNLYVADHEKELVDKLIGILQRQFSISPNVYIRPVSGRRTTPIHYIRLNRTSFAEGFRLRGVPEFVFHSTNDTVAAFLQGLFDADGHFTDSIDKRDGSRSGAIGLKQKDIGVLRDIQLLLTRFGIHSRVYDSGLLKIADNWSIILFEQYVGFSARHKMARLQEFIQQMRRIVHYDRTVDEVVSIDDGGVQDVYDVEVPDTHQFLANSVISHNTGKSLLIKILAQDLEKIYKKEGIELYDVLAVPNPNDQYEPLIRYVPEGMGRRIKKASQNFISVETLKTAILRATLALLMVLGFLIFFTGLFIFIVFVVQTQDPAYSWFQGIFLPWMLIGALLIVFPMFILIFRGGGMGMGAKKDDQDHIPNILVDNGKGRKLYVNATVTNSGRMFGDIEWSPWGEARGLAKSTHHRVKAGEIHKANFKLLYFDELKNLKEEAAIELLTVMEDGVAPIKGHQSQFASTHTASQNVSSDPVDCMFFLVAAGNMDLIYSPQSILNRIPALKDRFYYGNIVKTEDEMDDTPLNRLKVAQVIADECFPPGTKLLTPSGWKRIEDFRVGDGCLSMNPQTRLIEEVPVKRTISRFQDGYLLRFKSNAVDITITPGHLMLLHRRGGKPFFVRAEDIPILSPPRRWKTVWNRITVPDGGESQRISLWNRVDESYKVGVRWRGRNRYTNPYSKNADWRSTYHGFYETRKPFPNPNAEPGEIFIKGFEKGGRWSRLWEYDTCDLAELIGWYIAEGCRSGSRVFISQYRSVNPDNHRAIVNLVTKMGLRPQVGERSICFSDRLLSEFLGEKCGDGARNKRIPEEVFGWGHKALSRLWDALTKGDGHRSGSGADNMVLDTSSDSLVSDFIRLSVLIGRFAHEISQAGNTRRVSTLPRGEFPISSVERVPYKGQVYCVELERNNTVLAMQRGKPIWIGQCYRFNFPPMTKDGVNEIIAHMRRKASSNKKLKIRFRYVINILKKSSQLAWDRGKDYIDDVIIRETIEDYAKPIGQQILEHNIEKSQPYKIIKTKGEEVGLVNGLVVIKYSHGDEDSTGDIAPVSAYVRRVKTDKHADFVVTGIANPDKSEWIQDSIKTVRTAIYRLYGEDLARRYYVHVSFLQSRGVDGPSAGVTMTLALMSLLGDPDVPKEDRKPIPLRQDTAVTGTVENIGVNGNDVRVGAIGGVAEKSFGARKRGIHRIIVPRENFESSVEAADFKRMKIRLVPAATVKEYFNLIRADRRKQK